MESITEFLSDIVDAFIPTVAKADSEEEEVCWKLQ